MTTYTVRPEGCTAWASSLPSIMAATKAKREAEDRGLRRVIITDQDGNRIKAQPPAERS